MHEQCGNIIRRSEYTLSSKESSEAAVTSALSLPESDGIWIPYTIMANGSRYFRKIAITERSGIFEEFSVVLPMILFQFLYGRNKEIQYICIYVYTYSEQLVSDGFMQETFEMEISGFILC